MQRTSRKIVRKTKEEKIQKKNDNDLYLTDLSNVSRTIYNCGQEGLQDMLESKERVLKSYPYPITLTKLFYFLYFSGARLGEGLKCDRIITYVLDTTINDNKVSYIEKYNLKHFKNAQDRADGKNTYTVENIPLDGEYDKKIWDFLMQSKDDKNKDGKILSKEFKVFGEYPKNQPNMSAVIKRHFKTTLTDGENTDYQGITPHILRHLRFYNVKINKGYPDDLIQSYFGYWNVEFEESPNKFIVVDKYSVDSVIDNFNLDEENDDVPDTSEIEGAIIDDFEYRLEEAYSRKGMTGIRKLLRPFKM